LEKSWGGIIKSNTKKERTVKIWCEKMEKQKLAITSKDDENDQVSMR
jgi:hypothetical protein